MAISEIEIDPDEICNGCEQLFDLCECPDEECSGCGLDIECCECCCEGGYSPEINVYSAALRMWNAHARSKQPMGRQ